MLFLSGHHVRVVIRPLPDLDPRDQRQLEPRRHPACVSEGDARSANPREKREPLAAFETSVAMR